MHGGLCGLAVRSRLFLCFPACACMCMYARAFRCRFQRFDNEHVTIEKDGQINIMRSEGEAGDDRTATIFMVTLKRGAWGPEHCLVSPEEVNTVNHGGWSHEAGVLSSW